MDREDVLEAVTVGDGVLIVFVVALGIGLWIPKGGLLTDLAGAAIAAAAYVVVGIYLTEREPTTQRRDRSE